MGVLRTVRSVAEFKSLEWDPQLRRLSRCASIEDLREVARRRLPGGVFDYIDGGAEDEVTLEANSDAFAAVGLRPRVLRDVSAIDPACSLLGQSLRLPLVLAPTGFTRIAHPDGERAVARIAGKWGVPYVLSTLSTSSIEEVAEENGDGPRWFQVYVWRDRGLVSELISRAKNAGYQALCLTVDTAVLGRRERDHRRGFTLPPKVGLDTLREGMLRPGWTWSFLRSAPITFSNVTGHGVGDGSDTAVSLSDYISSQFDPALSWDDLDWFQEQWNGPIVLKGIQTLEDARIASRMGVDAIAISNHGGRQLDTAPVPLRILKDIHDELGGDVELVCDGGVRRGADIVKAVALGADAAMTGRPYLYGLAAAGESGVDWVLSRLYDDLFRTLALLGCNSLSDVQADHVEIPRSWFNTGAERHQDGGSS